MFSIPLFGCSLSLISANLLEEHHVLDAEGSSEAQMSQPFHWVPQLVSSGCLKPLDG